MVQTSIPCMQLPYLAKREVEPMSYETLKGIFADFRGERCSRKDLVSAIDDWQVTAAKEALNGRN